MNHAELAFLSATSLKDLYAKGEVSPVEVVRSLLQRVEAIDPLLNAMTMVTPELALEAATKAEQAYRGARTPRLLEGIPVTLKDMHPTAGLKTAQGSWASAEWIPDTDAPCISRLYRAGGAVIGKTSVPEFGWKGVSKSPLTGITHNPWKRGYNAGASSAGAAVAAAVGFGPLHLGSDGGGSVRMPAHFSGVYGLKPTYGRIPYWPVPNNDYATHMGTLTRTVADSALMLEAMAGPHAWDHTSCESPPEPYVERLKASLKGKRIAFSADLGHARVDLDVKDLVDRAVLTFEELGAVVEVVTPSWGTLGPELARFFWKAGYLARGALYLPEWREKMDPGLVAMLDEGQSITGVEFHVMRARKLAYVEEIHRFFENWDLLITPAVSTAAFPAHLLQPPTWPQHPWDWLMWAEFSYPFNFSGNPAASIPCGFNSSGLPVGLQIVGRRFDDLGVLQASAAFEEARPWQHHRPPIAETRD
ncbi:aspartyl-tRNA(Asn)/glutamyl-tRNA(Gln) amidotransferase subunit A [Enhydrobacter aerosaccus]|uniref:Aspartyl-tRNA(Asn)/glutamyl-tRNA(Gln) amidotransferase subunit A n=1 Tax=Enhydrobacter aerosaccus TaxID=225324 RepID=A0A1T4JK63_9HYPH|nr:amidase family protein [Enhydrobacter aerosaccus]SJZ30518.1 aspartyl-tRNA(Asn)/glutamyl-tRNA(Gln) amidotransferase subunit A [Enhydrobacter aerosaccus]